MMEPPHPASHLQSLLRFFETGEYSDFEIRCQDYHFKVHRVILNAGSKYFEVVTGRSFKEAGDKFLTLNSETPIMIARMIQSLYMGDYGTPELEMSLRTMFEGARKLTPNQSTTNIHAIQHISLKTHAIMYALADGFEAPFLKALAKTKFNKEIESDTLSHLALISVIGVVYRTTPPTDEGLRMSVVYKCQTLKMELQRLPEFEVLMKNSSDFAWDFGTKYSARTQLWCPACTAWSKIPATCSCGFYGICGSKTCDGVIWEKLKCQMCKQSGQMLRDQPSDADVIKLSSTTHETGDGKAGSKRKR